MSVAILKYFLRLGSLAVLVDRVGIFLQDERCRPREVLLGRRLVEEAARVREERGACTSRSFVAQASTLLCRTPWVPSAIDTSTRMVHRCTLDLINKKLGLEIAW